MADSGQILERRKSIVPPCSPEGNRHRPSQRGRCRNVPRESASGTSAIEAETWSGWRGRYRGYLGAALSALLSTARILPVFMTSISIGGRLPPTIFPYD